MRLHGNRGAVDGSAANSSFKACGDIDLGHPGEVQLVFSRIDVEGTLNLLVAHFFQQQGGHVLKKEINEQAAAKNDTESN